MKAENLSGGATSGGSGAERPFGGSELQHQFEPACSRAATPLEVPVVLVNRPDFGMPNSDASQPDGTNARRFRLAARFRF